jgi:dipeptidyl aminopeptidase/acylaminoacyl peptidase
MGVSLRLVAACLVMSAAGLAAGDDGSRLRVEAFARLPEYTDMDLSPDGSRLAAVINRGGQTTVFTRTVTDPKIYPLLSTDNKTHKVNWIKWANDDHVVVSVRFPSQLNATGGTKFTSSRMLVAKWNDPSTFRAIIPPDEEALFIPQFQDRVVDWLPEEEDWIIVAVDLDVPLSLSLYKFRISKDGKKVVSAASGGRIVDWVLDGNHVPRVYTNFQDNEYRINYRPQADSSYKLGWKFDAYSEDEVTPLAFAKDPDTLYVTANKDGYRALFSVDLSAEDLPMTLVHARSGYDVPERLLRSTWRGGVVGVLSPGDDSSYHLWDEEYAAFDGSINRALPDTENFIIDMSHDGTAYLLYVVGSDTPGRFYYGDRETKQVSVVGSSYPMLEGLDLPEMKRVSYAARDGLEIEAFLTLPLDVEAKDLPTIILPHGGPIAADTDHFDYWTQFFANRGYAVLQMNFRGSSGYGHDFMMAGMKSWGLQMQDDIHDGLKWMIDQEITDKNRVCIVGGSYGGYAALMGVAKAPDLFKCAVSFAGISDLEMLVKNSRRYADSKLVQATIGHLRQDRDKLRANSPRRLAGAIEAPILLAHGDADRVVPVEQSELMAKALEEAGKTFQLLVFEDGDHHLSKEEHRLRLFRMMDLFLARHLAAPTAPKSNEAATETD